MTLAADTQDLLDSLGADVAIPSSIKDANSKQLSAPSNHHSPGKTSSIEDKAISLLGSGISAESVAAALGVSPSRISQLLADPAKAAIVANLRYENLQSHNKRDSAYDSLEDKLLDKLNNSISLLVRPDQILKAISIINGAKRRGQSAPDTATTTNNIVNLTLPASIAAKFITNGSNQVIRAGDQDLVTMQSGNLLKQIEKAQQAALEHKE